MVSKTVRKYRAEPRSSASATSGWLSAGAVAAAVGASLCCVAPFVLVLLGLGGGWMSTLVGLSSYRPLFIGLTLLFLLWAFHRLYLTPCAAGKTCEVPAVRRRQRIVFWLVTAATLGLIAFPWYAPWFLD